MIINETTEILSKRGLNRKVEISLKRRFIRNRYSGKWTDIQLIPAQAKEFSSYNFEILNHDLLLAFAPKESSLPLMMIVDPTSEASWGLSLPDFDPEFIGVEDNVISWKLADGIEFRLVVLGHLIHKEIIFTKKPSRRKFKFGISRSSGDLEKSADNLELYASVHGNRLFKFARPKILLSDEVIKLTPSISSSQYSSFNIEIIIPENILNDATYPVILDPTVILQPGPSEGKDAYIKGGPYQDINFGSNQNVQIGRANNTTVYTLMQFKILESDGGSVPSGASIDSAELEMWLWSHSGGTNSIGPYRVVREWSETLCNWNRAVYPPGNWQIAGADGENDREQISLDTWTDVTSGDLNSWVSFHLTNTIQAIVNSGTDYGFKFHGNPSIKSQLWGSDYINDPSKRPILTIEYSEAGGFANKINFIGGKTIGLIGG